MSRTESSGISVSVVGELVHQRQVRQDRDVGWVSGLPVVGQGAGQVVRRLPVDDRAGLLLPDRLDGFEAVELGSAPQAEDADVVALEAFARRCSWDPQ